MCARLGGGDATLMCATSAHSLQRRFKCTVFPGAHTKRTWSTHGGHTEGTQYMLSSAVSAGSCRFRRFSAGFRRFPELKTRSAHGGHTVLRELKTVAWAFSKDPSPSLGRTWITRRSISLSKVPGALPEKGGESVRRRRLNCSPTLGLRSYT